MLMMSKPSAVPEPDGTRFAAHPDPADPAHVEWLIDEANDESFPASDASAIAQPHAPSSGKKTWAFGKWTFAWRH